MITVFEKAGFPVGELHSLSLADADNDRAYHCVEEADLENAISAIIERGLLEKVRTIAASADPPQGVEYHLPTESEHMKAQLNRKTTFSLDCYLNAEGTIQASLMYEARNVNAASHGQEYEDRQPFVNFVISKKDTQDDDSKSLRSTD